MSLVVLHQRRDTTNAANSARCCDTNSNNTTTSNLHVRGTARNTNAQYTPRGTTPANFCTSLRACISVMLPYKRVYNVACTYSTTRWCMSTTSEAPSTLVTTTEPGICTRPCPQRVHHGHFVQHHGSRGGAWKMCGLILPIFSVFMWQCVVLLSYLPAC